MVQPKFNSLIFHADLYLQIRAKYVILLRPAEWRNGRRWGLKIPCPLGRVGSTPTSAIIRIKTEYGQKKQKLKNRNNAPSVNMGLLSRIIPRWLYFGENYDEKDT